MTPDEFDAEVDRAVAAHDFGQPSARKSGRNWRYPYVPIVKWVDDVGAERTTQRLARAFATRDEAVDYAREHLERCRVELARDLRDPRKRALRQFHGLPREVPR